MPNTGTNKATGGETLHPVVQLRFGAAKSGSTSGQFFERRVSQPYVGVAQSEDSYAPPESFILTIPPQNLVEFTNESTRGVDKVNIVFIDHTFGSIEDQLFRCDREYNGRIMYRWGYPGLGLEEGNWHIMQLQDYLPTITSSGLRVTIMGLAVGSEFATHAEPKVYQGKISTVVQQIALELGFTDPHKVFIEETDDDVRDEVPKNEWATGNMTRIDLINSKLLPEAKSKKNPQGTFIFRLGSEGTFHFHTSLFKPIKQAVLGSSEPQDEQKYRRFNVLFGIPNGVESFTPRYSAKIMGQLAASCVAGVYDPRTKQFQQKIIDRNTLGMTTNQDPKGGGRTSAPPFAKPEDEPSQQRAKAETYSYQPVRQVALGGSCSGKQIHQHYGPEAALNKIEAAWKRLHEYVQGGQLELVGLPEYCDFTTMEIYCEVAVYLPADIDRKGVLSGQPQFKSTNASLHWSSGRYLLMKITHHISTAYRISVELGRPTGLEGPDAAKTKLPDVTIPTTTGVAR